MNAPKAPPPEQEIAIPPGPVLWAVGIVTVVAVLAALGASQLAAEPGAMALATGLGALGGGVSFWAAVSAAAVAGALLAMVVGGWLFGEEDR
jgi:hypothetical protein